jgi:hypothetical protein
MTNDFTLSRHAREEMERRGIDPADVDGVLKQPEQVVPGHGELRVYQARIEAEGKQYLLRVVINEAVDPAVVVTVYRTSKVSKYWRSE